MSSFFPPVLLWMSELTSSLDNNVSSSHKNKQTVPKWTRKFGKMKAKNTGHDIYSWQLKVWVSLIMKCSVGCSIADSKYFASSRWTLFQDCLDFCQWCETWWNFDIARHTLTQESLHSCFLETFKHSNRRIGDIRWSRTEYTKNPTTYNDTRTNKK